MSETEKRYMIRQHEPIRVPQGWNAQERAMIMQIERIFDDVNRQIEVLRREINELHNEAEP